MQYLNKLESPQLELIHSGKVRESYRIDDKTRMLVVTDRISSFDNVLNNYIPGKGAVLNGITNFWFEKTRHIIDNHFIEAIDPNLSLVKEVEPIRVEMIVRGYLTGSMWRGYKKGKREFSGVKIEEGMQQNQRFTQPILTPTTKEDIDREITPEAIIEEGWASRQVYQQMAQISMELFEFGSKFLEERGIVLVDTKYEFGILDGKLVLIDEIHTPDSSRFWSLAAYQKNPLKVDSIDKEYVRQWLLNNQEDGKMKTVLPEEVVQEAARRYRDIYKTIVGQDFTVDLANVNDRVYKNLLKAQLIKDGYVAIVMGSPSDLAHCQKLKEKLEKYDIFVEMRVVSAHKNGERILELAQVYNNSLEPGAVIAVAGRSNGLGGALAANLAVPVFNCPPFKDKDDIMVNVYSSLMMPSQTPAATMIDLSSAVLVALRSLNLQRLKATFRKEITEMKAKLLASDQEISQK
ncbi:MAG TPA: phosphoribosylaminoimidazolesuccinocarboxamide synthase [Candidatus Cloacimonas sp.]|jgi:phosphoribosylaminoimidazole-succinocarboxamide synthase|nr:phosphoribosylaminoimidazolesuccinocarboxamide synthase [Candidatus Cloacimonas sp.]